MNKVMEVWRCPGRTATVQAPLGGFCEASVMKKISNKGGRKTEVCSLFNILSHHGYQLDRKKTQLRLNTVCGSHSHSGLSIT